jgi:NADH-quinone oxidoreductase subunit N
VIAADVLVGPSIDWFALSPLLVLLGGAMVLLVVGSLTPKWPRGLYAGLTVACGVAATVIALIHWQEISDEGPRFLVKDALHFDKFSVWVTVAICAGLVMASLITDDYLRREQQELPEVYALYLLSALGGIVMGAAADLIVLFLGLEILSIALYVLAASHRRRAASQESGLKYFVLGGFSSAFFLYGVALVYGSAGSTNYAEIVNSFNTALPLERADAMMLAGVALLLVGLAFKVGAVPFHFWTPDVYEGAPSPVTAFMASAAKAAAFAAMLRVLITALPHWRDDYRPVVWVLAVVTLVGGSLMAVVQTNVKRMLAFSSISHAGFLLVGVEAAAHTAGQNEGQGMSSTLLYLLLYAMLVTGTFAVVTLVGRTGDSNTSLDGFRGLGRSHPALALGMTVLLLAQAGVPLTSGFVAKFGVIQAAVDEESYAIAIIAMVAAVIAAFLYLRIMISMWIADPVAGDDAREKVRVPLGAGLAIVLSVAATLWFGFFPDWLIDASKAAAGLTP